MKFQKFCRKGFGQIFFGLVVLSAPVWAQTTNSGIPTLINDNPPRQMPLAGANTLYCAGYVESGTVDTSRKIVGAENEQDQFLYSQGNNLVVNLGSGSGVKAGDMFTVVRPRGQVGTRWTSKDDLGFYVQEVGVIEIVDVKSNVSIARVKTSCDNILLGDLLQPTAARTSPTFAQRPLLDVFADPSGRARGRIFMARDGAELIGREMIVYIDLGSEDGAQAGNYVTVYRPLGKGNLFTKSQKESVSARDENFQSNVYRGGKFSNQAGRKSGSEAKGGVVTTEEAKEDRPQDLRKGVGELIILSVRGKTATALVTRTAQEIHTGDYVELQ